MRYIFLVLILIGGGLFFWNNFVQKEVIPTPQILSVKDGDRVIGRAIALTNVYGVMSLHLYSDGVLVGERKIEKITEDIDRDLVLWKSSFGFAAQTITTESLKHGEFLYLLKGEDIQKMWLDDKSISAEFGMQKLENIWTFTGTIKPGDSGRPLVNEAGEIRAIIVGGNSVDKIVYAVPSEEFLNLLDSVKN